MENSFELLAIARQLRGIGRLTVKLSEHQAKAKDIAAIGLKIDRISEELTEISKTGVRRELTKLWTKK